MDSIPVIYNCPQKIVLKRKNSQIHLSASPVIEEENLVAYASKSYLQKKKSLCLPRFVKKPFHLKRTNHQSLADPPCSLGLRSSGISARLCVPYLTSCLVLWFGAVLLLVWGDCVSTELMDC